MKIDIGDADRVPSLIQQLKRSRAEAERAASGKAIRRLWLKRVKVLPLTEHDLLCNSRRDLPVGTKGSGCSCQFRSKAAE